MVKFNRVGTLGNNYGYLTCSMYVAKKKYPNSKIIGYPTYESALPDLKSNTISYLLIPAAYPGLKDFIMENDILVNDVFIEKIPPLVLVKKSTKCQSGSANRIYLHPATSKLLEEVIPTKHASEIIFVDSNIMACERLLKDNDDNVMAISNILCARFFHLHIEKILRCDIKMPWILFRKLDESK